MQTRQGKTNLALFFMQLNRKARIMSRNMHTKHKEEMTEKRNKNRETQQLQ